jgi:hypothetical protein
MPRLVGASKSKPGGRATIARPADDYCDITRYYSGRKCMPGLTKTFAEFEETAIDRFGFCFSTVFISDPFLGATSRIRKIRRFGAK